MSLIYEPWLFMRVRKKFQLLPIMVMMVVFVGLTVFTEEAAIAPFVYKML
jgi:hypothetical protein